MKACLTCWKVFQGMEGSRSTIRCDNLALRPRLDYRATFAYDRMFGHVLALVTQECVLEGKDVQTQHETFHNFYIISLAERLGWTCLIYPNRFAVLLTSTCHQSGSKRLNGGVGWCRCDHGGFIWDFYFEEMLPKFSQICLELKFMKIPICNIW